MSPSRISPESSLVTVTVVVVRKIFTKGEVEADPRDHPLQIFEESERPVPEEKSESIREEALAQLVISNVIV